MSKKYGICVCVLLLSSIFSQVHANSTTGSYGSSHEIDIIKPKEGYLYVLDMEIMPIPGDTIIVGDITVNVRTSGKNSEMIGFYVDDFFMGSDSGPPYVWTWDEASMSSHLIEVMGYKDATHLYGERKVTYINSPAKAINPPPQPILVKPSNTNILYNKEYILVTEDNIIIRAIDLQFSPDIVSVSFEYSRDGENWIPITAHLSEYPDTITLSGGDNIEVTQDVWSTSWSLVGFSEGDYFIKVIMEDKRGRVGVDTTNIYYDPSPPVPHILSPLDEQANGRINITATCEDGDVALMEALMSPLLPDYYEQHGLGREKEDYIGPVGDDGINRYCTPTAVKNALHRLATQHDPFLFPPGETEEIMNIAMARDLAMWMKTSSNGGTATVGIFPDNFYEGDNVSPGIKAYLYARGFRGEKSDDYFITSYKTSYNVKDDQLIPLATSIYWDIYESEIQKGSAVIVDIHKWNRGENVIGGGHTLTGKGAKHTSSNGAHTCSFIDPENGNEITTSWKTIRGLPTIEYPPDSGEWWLVNGIWIISPQHLNYQVIGSDSDPAGGWNVAWDTHSLENGLYLIEVILEDRAGNVGSTSYPILVNN